jgi:hydroxyacylglutathione hydrolase
LKLEQIYTGCLAQGAYYIASENEAVVIDPLREVEPYLNRAKADGVKIKYVLETHFHADFVSGHLDLAAKSGAKIVFGPTAKPNFEAYIASDGEIIHVGKVKIKVLHTPGHTMESVTYLLQDETGKDVAIFSGDTLFLGDVGRPDLAQKAASMTKEQLAGLLYDSLRNKIMPLADDVIVYPAHGAGSACGKNMMKETVDTLGNQKKLNYALRPDLSRDEFIRELTENLLPAPAYFPENVRMNKEGYESIDQVLRRGTRELTVAEFEVAMHETEALIIDTREAQVFAGGFIPGSINIGIDGSFAPWVGALVPGTDHPLLVITEKGREVEVVTRLARVGYNNTLGFLGGGFEAWFKSGKEIDKIESIDALSLGKKFVPGETTVIDVRKPGEFEAEHVDGALNVPLDFLNDQIDEIPSKGKVYVHCAGGYRSMIALSILRARGWKNLIDVAGGFKAMQATNIPRTDFVCSTKKVKK